MFAVDAILAAGRALDLAARAGDPVDLARADEVVRTLSAYVASLSPDVQAETARRLVAALAERRRFTATVPPREG